MSDQSRKWKVKGKQGNRPVVVNVDDVPTKDSAEEYARFFARTRSKQPLVINETVEKTKRKKP